MAINTFYTIPGFSNYTINKEGVIKNSRDRKLKGSIHKGTGYRRVTILSDSGEMVTKQIHTLMGITFLGYISEGKYKKVIDHKDNNRLNNMLSNLQILSHRDNSSKDRVKTSKYIGVSWYKKTNSWQAKIRKDGKCIRLGKFNNEYDAHKAYQSELSKIKSQYGN